MKIIKVKKYNVIDAKSGYDTAKELDIIRQKYVKQIQVLQPKYKIAIQKMKDEGQYKGDINLYTKVLKSISKALPFLA